MERNVKCVKSPGARSPDAPVGKQTHPKDRAIEGAGLRFEVLAKFHRSGQVLLRSLEALKTRIVENLRLVVVDERLDYGRKVKKHCPQKECEIWEDAAEPLHGRYYVRVRRDSVYRQPAACRFPGIS